MSSEETPIEKMRRISYWSKMEDESLMMSLPSFQAIEEFFDLWDFYNTDFMQGIEEGITEGDDPQPLIDFVKKYDLSWTLDWIEKHRKSA